MVSKAILKISKIVSVFGIHEHFDFPEHFFWNSLLSTETVIGKNVKSERMIEGRKRTAVSP